MSDKERKQMKVLELLKQKSGDTHASAHGYNLYIKPSENSRRSLNNFFSGSSRVNPAAQAIQNVSTK